jgi:membrane protein
MMRRLRFLWQVLAESANGFLDDCALRLSAALSYYSVFSLAPLLVLAITLGGWIFGEQAARGQVSQQLRHYMGDKAADGVESMMAGASLHGHSATAVVIGIVTLLLGASGVFGQLKDALNTIWRMKTKSGRGVAAFIRDRLLSFGLVLAIGFLLLISLLVTTLLAGFTQYTRAHLPVPDFAWGGVNLLVSLCVSTALFATIFKILPDARIPWKTVAAGSFATAIFFEIGKFGLAFYLGRESTVSMFGAAGSVILVLLWVYYAAAILLFGAEITRAYARLSGAAILPSPFAEPVEPEQRVREGMAPAHESIHPLANGGSMKG